jgi:hypothetical protein
MAMDGSRRNHTVEQLLAEVRSEALWLKRFNGLAGEHRQLPLLRNQLRERRERLDQLQAHLFREGVSPDNTLIPTLARMIDLIKEGADERVARANAELDILIGLHNTQRGN